jgi:di/tricarboxylate transporter
MTWHALASVGFILVTMVLFASERVRVDVVALIALAALAVLGIITPSEALSGFSNEATVTVAAMFALSLGIERSGVLEPLARVLSRINKPWVLTLAIMLVIAPLGAFIKNIALVATFLPLALRVCTQTRTSPSRVLMPMADAAQMGGVCTLIGTSSNLLTDSIARSSGLPGFGVFEFTELGAILAVAGILYIMLFGRWLLPRESSMPQQETEEIGKYVTELRVTEKSSLLDQTITEAVLGENNGIYPLELLRGERRMWSPRSQKLQIGDVLLVRGSWDKIENFRTRTHLENAPETRYAHGKNDAPRVIAEVMVAPASPMEGHRLGETALNWRYDATVLAIHRRGHILREKLSNVSLAVGDVLMVLVDEVTMPRLRADENLIVLSQRETNRRIPRKAMIAVGIMAAVVLVSGLKWLPIPIAAVSGAAAMALTGCFGTKDVYEGMDWKIIILLGAILPIGTAIQKTGLSHAVVEGAMGLVGYHSPLAALLMVYLLTALLTELMGHNPAAVLMVGIAISVAHAIGVSAQPFVVAVAFAAATSFATPVGYPTNTMVYYAGGYKFTDFMKVGIPLIGLFCGLSMWLIPIFWPFHP